MTLTLVTYDWLPDFPRGYVRDMRVRWMLEEIGRAYLVETVPAHPKSEAHRAMHPFTQVPVLSDGDRRCSKAGRSSCTWARAARCSPKPVAR